MEKVRHGDKPFFLNYCTSLVHGPVSARDRKRFEHYCKKLGIPVPTKLGSTNKARAGQKNPYYATMVDTTDWIVGKLVTYLEQTDDPRNPGHKLIENTLVIFASDNGSENKSKTYTGPLRSNKGSTYDGGHRTPFFASWPAGKIGDGNAKTPAHARRFSQTIITKPPRRNPTSAPLSQCAQTLRPSLANGNSSSIIASPTTASFIQSNSTTSPSIKRNRKTASLTPTLNPLSISFLRRQ